MGIATIPAAAGGGGLEPKYQKFTSSGTFTLPAGYDAAKPLLVNIQVIGGGGGGSGFPTNNHNTSAYWGYFGDNSNASITGTSNMGGTGGSGGIAATQMYLTSNLTITVGAAGSRGTVATTFANIAATNYGSTNGSWNITWGNVNSGGSGGTTTAGSVQSTGGAGGTANFSGDAGRGTANNTGLVSTTQGTGGSPAGTTGKATPLLGTIAGGSSDTTPVRGSFGIGGISTDGATSTGVEGTGAGAGSIGGSGAVILTWWQ